MGCVTSVYKKIKKHVAEWNSFEDVACRSDPFHLRNAIISTRVYVTLLTVSVTIIIAFLSLGDESKVNTIRNPSEGSYRDLLEKNATSLSCPCSRVTVPYLNFTWTTVEYHPVCSSGFVSQEWIDRLFSPDIGRLYQGDFRASASSLFQLLAAFCSHSKRSVNDALDEFHSDTLLTTDVLLPKSFEAQVQAYSQFLRLSTANSVRRLLQSVRSTTHANGLQTAIQSSQILLKQIGDSFHVIRTDVEFIYADSSRCMCKASLNCSQPIGFFENGEGIINYITPPNGPMEHLTKFLVGCNPVESLLRSTLECLFDSLCLENIQNLIPSSNTTSASVLNTSQIRFTPNMSIEEIINELFIENWTTTQSFSNYFTQCAPILCTYISIQRNNALYVLTKLLGFYGGLAAALRLCVPVIIGWWRKRKLINSEEPRPTRSLKERLRTAWQSIRVKIIELNLFKTPTMRTDPFELTTLKISTWIYLVLLCLSMIIIVLFTWLNVRTQNVTVEDPSQEKFEELQKNYSRSLQCPCTRINIPHHSFISLSPQFHPVCESSFVSEEWINAFGFAGMKNTDRNSTDIFISGHKYFIGVAALCQLVKTTVSDASFTFNQSSLITGQTLSEAELTARANQTLSQFKSNTVAEFKRNLALINSQTSTIYTAGEGDVTWILSPWVNSTSVTNIESIPAQINNCSCALSDECKETIVMYNYTGHDNVKPFGVEFPIPNMFVSCFSMQSLLQSSLEWLFDEKYLSDVTERLINITDKTTEQPINSSSILQTNSTQFFPNTSIQELVNVMMIEIDSWGQKIEYKQYYDLCAPKLCSYIITSRSDALYVFTTIVGLFGGLSVALKIIVPLIVGWIRNRMRPRGETVSMTGSSTFRERVHALWRLIKTKVLELNMFESEISWDDDQRRHNEIITTRIYLFFLTSAVGILIVYTIAADQTQTITVNNPSQVRFERLVSNPGYLSTLDCPCQNISIPYDSFMSISPQYHQLCSSDFVARNSSWIDLIHYRSNPVNYSYDDYRLFVVPHFRLLSYLCTLANDTLVDALSIFRSNTLISKRAQSRQVVKTQVESAIDQFRKSTPQTFMRMLDFIREMAQGNGLVSSIYSNWYPLPLEGENGYILFGPRSYGANNCSCGTSSMCMSFATIDTWKVPGFFVGCSPLESLLQSTLECLYNFACINLLRKPNQQYLNITIDPLDVTLSSPNVTVQSLMNELMIVRWERNITYENYYATCAPTFCTYVPTERANPLYIITTIIGFYGGLTVALQMIVPVLVKFGRYLIIYRRQRIEPAVPVVSAHE